MPLCVNCTQRVEWLYTVYETTHNLRLEQCPACQTFADPYVEHDSFTLLLDLILLKRAVYRHLLYNRGSPPRISSEKNFRHADPGERELRRWNTILRLGSSLVLVDAFIRWSHLHRTTQPSSPWVEHPLPAFLKILVGCFAETMSFHLGVITGSSIVLSITRLFGRHRHSPSATSSSHQSGETFSTSLIPLSLFYSSLTKLFLLFLFTIWPPSLSPIPPSTMNMPFNENKYTQTALRLFDEGNVDREWVIRNVLGGMSAGFGLRVVLDVPPIFTTLTILAGWWCKTFVARAIVNSDWIGAGDGSGLEREIWLAYSIP
ncbi:Arv1-like family-domain-containing protein [Flagelloscypha sp. PMI_526]|nr:Arv1-like family-domain-containing protein [Flagelloscypha sp. PMI_526]